MRDASTTQWLINTLDYPPTHQYNFVSLNPEGVLAERFEILLNLDSHFLSRESFLDVGANKGFFPQVALESGAVVSAIEPDAQFHELLSGFSNSKFTLHTGGFRNFATQMQFKTVWIGNTHHYLEREAPGYKWVSKLAALVAFDGLVIIEGPTERSPDVPHDLVGTINEQLLILAMSPFFTLLSVMDSPSYTPGRRFWKFRRINPATLKINDVKPSIILKPIEYDTNHNKKMALIKSNDHVIKTSNDALSESELMSVIIADTLDSTVGRVSSFILDTEEKIIGWMEPYIADAAKEIDVHFGLKEKEIQSNSEQILAEFLRRTIELSSVGFVDIDAGMANWIKQDGKMVNFDKNSCHQIGNLSLDQIFNVHVVFQNNYKQEFGEKLGKDLVSALLTRNPEIISNWAQHELEKLLASERSRLIDLDNFQVESSIESRRLATLITRIKNKIKKVLKRFI